jgi:hypothetical protein
MVMKENWFKEDDVRVNSWWDYDYCFCGADCKNTECGRNKESNSYKRMLKDVGYHSMADFSGHCEGYKEE